MQTAPAVLNTKRERNYGIDLLRIVSMLMIIILHMCGHGGILKNTVPLSYRYEVAWFLETASYCAVNCYALISGYVGIKSKFKYSGIAALWLQVAFYTVSIAVIMAIVSPNMGKTEVFNAFFPVSNKTYWYFTAYFCISFFTPVVNKAFESLTNGQLKAIGVAIILLFSVLPLLAEKDVFFTNRGYSPIWLILLYVLGGIIARCDLFSKTKPVVFILLYFVMVVITWGERLICDYLNSGRTGDDLLKIRLTLYTSPTVLFSAIFLIMGFSKIKTGKIASKLIGIFAPVSFSVYLIHENPYVREAVIKKLFVDFPKFGAVKIFFVLLISAVAIYLVCAAIDMLREQIFKLLRVKKTLQKIELKLFKNIW